MIKLSRMADYGVILMVNLARSDKGPRTASDLSEATALPQPTVSKLLKQLAAAGLLTSRRGAAGGYGLARESRSVSIAEIVAALDGPIALTECITSDGIVCEIEALCPTRSNWHLINNAIVEALERVSLADMAEPTFLYRPDAAVHQQREEDPNGYTS